MSKEVKWGASKQGMGSKEEGSKDEHLSIWRRSEGEREVSIHLVRE